MSIILHAIAGLLAWAFWFFFGFFVANCNRIIRLLTTKYLFWWFYCWFHSYIQWTTALNHPSIQIKLYPMIDSSQTVSIWKFRKKNLMKHFNHLLNWELYSVTCYVVVINFRFNFAFYIKYIQARVYSNTDTLSIRYCCFICVSMFFYLFIWLASFRSV